MLGTKLKQPTSKVLDDSRFIYFSCFRFTFAFVLGWKRGKKTLIKIQCLGMDAVVEFIVCKAKIISKYHTFCVILPWIWWIFLKYSHNIRHARARILSAFHGFQWTNCFDSLPTRFGRISFEKVNTANMHTDSEMYAATIIWNNGEEVKVAICDIYLLLIHLICMRFTLHDSAAPSSFFPFILVYCWQTEWNEMPWL